MKFKCVITLSYVSTISTQQRCMIFISQGQMLFPFSFAEYIQYFGLTDKYTAFDNYMLEGGMSDSYLYKEQEDKYDYIENVFDILILRDIRQKVSDN